MYPYINIGSFHLGTFGLLLWLAAVVATVVLHRNFVRQWRGCGCAERGGAGGDCRGDWGEGCGTSCRMSPELRAAMRQIALPGWQHPMDVVMGFLHWFQAGFAWFGGMLAGIAMLMWQGQARFKAGWPGRDAGAAGGRVRMLDLAAPAAAIGYGVGRIGCLTSGRWGLRDQDDAAVGRAHGARMRWCLPTIRRMPGAAYSGV